MQKSAYEVIMRFSFKLRKTVEDFTHTLSLMKHAEIADDVKFEVERYLIVSFITQCKDNPECESGIIKDTVRKNKDVLYV